MRKNELKKCRTCNFKKRLCAINPLACKALKVKCALCEKIGHFPQSKCCHLKRKMQKKKSYNGKKKNCIENSVSISKRNMKKISLKIKQLEFQVKRESIINLAENCALKFKDKSSSKILSKYCMKKL